MAPSSALRLDLTVGPEPRQPVNHYPHTCMENPVLALGGDSWLLSQAPPSQGLGARVV